MKEQNSQLYYFKVQVVGEPDTWLEIATTRPETIPGDSGFAVNPRDPRYSHLVGKHAHPAVASGKPGAPAHRR